MEWYMDNELWKEISFAKGYFISNKGNVKMEN